jgi:Na+-transporting NADH:ubiquinone oxidoreductase subunit NqrC
MNQYIKLLIFITIVAFFTSFAFIAMDLLFSEKIEQNQNKAYYTTVLEHNEIEYDDASVFDIFDANINIDTFQYNGKELVVYSDSTTGNVSFIFGLFDASGVWGDIIGIVTLDASFQIIVNVSVLQQEEQLGKDVSSRGFLDQFVGLNLDVNSLSPVIVGSIGDNGDLPNEVDQLAGATGTSNGFQDIINESYFIYRDLWESRSES